MDTKNKKLIELFKEVQRIPYQVCKYDENEIDEDLMKGDCRHKHFLLKMLLEREGFIVKEIKVIFDWRDLPIPKNILDVLKSGTIWDHSALKVKIGRRWLNIDCTWNPELESKGFPITKNWNGRTDTKQVTEGKLKFFDKKNFSREAENIKINKEEAHQFALKLNQWLYD